MLPILLDRITMGLSLAVHIILASIGIGLPIIMSIMEFIGIRRKDPHYTLFARRMTPVLIILFAIGTASGTIVALELFLLWPTFIQLMSQVAILPLYVEVFAFFSEAIFLGIYAYSWNKKLGKYTHWLMSVIISAGAMASGVLIIMLNSFMNTPSGFNIPNYLSTGVLSDINPLAAFSTASMPLTEIHALSASVFAAVFVLLGYFVWRMSKSSGESREYYKKAVKVMLAVVMVAVVILIISGILNMQMLLQNQPEKYAAIEGNYASQSNAPEIIGGIPVMNANGSFYFAYSIAIPGLQSLLAGGSTGYTVPGLSAYNQSTWPPLIVHPMFDFMFFVGIGIGLFLLLILVLLALKWRAVKTFVSKLRNGLIKEKLQWLSSVDPLMNRKFVILIIIASIFAVILLEDGWVMSELARQPWIIYNVMTVAQAGNPSNSILPVLVALIAFYIVILPLTVLILRKFAPHDSLQKDLAEIGRKKKGY